MTAALVILLVACFLMPLAAISLNRHFRLLEQQQVKAREITAIAALRDGQQARIRGVVVAREPLIKSAICEEACVGYRSTIYDADHGHSLLLSRERWTSFLVADDTGTLAVEGSLDARLDRDDGGDELPQPAYALLAEDQVRMTEAWGPRRVRFREKRLCVGDRVSVVGRPSPIDSGSGSRETPPARYVMHGWPGDPVLIADDDEAVTALFAEPPPLVPLEEVPPVAGPPRRAIEQRESTAIAALIESAPAKIRGVVSAREPLVTSPISGRACVGYRITIHQRSEAHPEHHGVLVVRGEAWPSFLVKDDTGTAVAEGPFSILLDPDDGGWTNLPASVYTLLQEANVRLDKEFAFRETLLVPGDRVALVGRPSLEVDPAGESSLREPPQLYVFRGSEEEPVALIDDEERLA